MKTLGQINKKRLVIPALLALTIAGCTTDPYTGQPKVANTAIGAGLGAAVGAGAGALIGAATGDASDARRGALIGAGIGALGGGSIGVYMDRQEAILRQRLAATGVSVTRVGDQIILNMPSNITFDSGQSDIKPQFYETLNSVALVLNEFNQSLVDIYGHTDSDGGDDFNLQLSRNRASSVASYLSSQQVNSQRFYIQGFGESQPVASNTSAAGKAQNRRVEIRITPLRA